MTEKPKQISYEGYIQDLIGFGPFGPLLTAYTENYKRLYKILTNDKTAGFNYSGTPYLVSPKKFKEIKSQLDKILPLILTNITSDTQVDYISNLITKLKMANMNIDNSTHFARSIATGIFGVYGMIIGDAVTKNNLRGLGWSNEDFLQACSVMANYIKMIMTKKSTVQVKNLSKKSVKTLKRITTVVEKNVKYVARGLAHVKKGKPRKKE